MQWIFHKGLRGKYLLHWTLTLYVPSLSWLMCLPHLSQLIHLLNSFLCLFPSYVLDIILFQYFYMILLKPSSSIVFIVCYNVCDDIHAINICCTDYLHSYNRLFKMGIISCKNKHPPFLPLMNYSQDEFLSNYFYL